MTFLHLSLHNSVFLGTLYYFLGTFLPTLSIYQVNRYNLEKNSLYIFSLLVNRKFIPYKYVNWGIIVNFVIINNIRKNNIYDYKRN